MKKLSFVHARALNGMKAPPVSVEVHIGRGLPAFSIVGLPETAVKESKDRVRAALVNSQFEFPVGRITVNLAPADLPKEGGRFDLPIAIGILAATGQIESQKIDDYEFMGELSLSGELRPVRGMLPIALKAQRSLIISKDNAHEAALAQCKPVLAADHLLQVCAHLNGIEELPQANTRSPKKLEEVPDLAEVQGQQQAKRALEIAAAGGHNMIMVGPPGTGKTMLASRLPGILPPMSHDEAVETAAVYSISDNGFQLERWSVRPFRSPHHTASGVALVGGGSHPRPGEISLAHNGVIFLDELPEFDRRVLEVLREPLESGRIIISRAARQAEYPASFQLIAAMNPCPCGYLGDSQGQCRCTEDQVQRYRNKISGPLLDRIDIHINVTAIPRNQLRHQDPSAEKSATVRKRVIQARQRQLHRANKANHLLSSKEIKLFCAVDDASHDLLEEAMERLQLSTRAYHRILKVARTIADLEGVENIGQKHIAEALHYRQLDRVHHFSQV